jgi:UDP-sugar pyrophosphorylase
LISLFTEASDEQKNALRKQVMNLNATTPGGLVDYCRRARKFLLESKIGVNSYDGFVPSVPQGVKVDIYSKEFDNLEELGMKEIKDTCFVLVAGGMGERLGYSSIKVGLPITLLNKELTYIKYY